MKLILSRRDVALAAFSALAALLFGGGAALAQGAPGKFKGPFGLSFASEKRRKDVQAYFDELLELLRKADGDEHSSHYTRAKEKVAALEGFYQELKKSVTEPLGTDEDPLYWSVRAADDLLKGSVKAILWSASYFFTHPVNAETVRKSLENINMDREETYRIASKHLRATALRKRERANRTLGQPSVSVQDTLNANRDLIDTVEIEKVADHIDRHANKKWPPRGVSIRK